MGIDIEYRKDAKYPTANALIQALTALQIKAGKPLYIVGGTMFDDTAIRELTIVNKDGAEWDGADKNEIAGIFIE